MRNKKEVIAAIVPPFIYTIGMGVANYIVYRFHHIEYGTDGFISAMLPFLTVLAAGSLICLLAQRGRLALPWEGSGRLPLYLVILLPLVAMALYYLCSQGALTYAFVAPVLSAALVGVAEELMFRRILYVRLLHTFEDQGSYRPLLISAVCFSLLHAVNLLAGLPVSQVLVQLAATFAAGLFYLLMYDYTRNIYLLILMHALWDYILLSGAATRIPVFAIAMGVLQVAEVVIMLVLLNARRRRAGDLGQDL